MCSSAACNAYHSAPATMACVTRKSAEGMSSENPLRQNGSYPSWVRSSAAASSTTRSVIATASRAARMTGALAPPCAMQIRLEIVLSASIGRPLERSLIGRDRLSPSRVGTPFPGRPRRPDGPVPAGRRAASSRSGTGDRAPARPAFPPRTRRRSTAAATAERAAPSAPTTPRHGLPGDRRRRERESGGRAHRARRRSGPTCPRRTPHPRRRCLPVPLICTICSPGTTPGDRLRATVATVTPQTTATDKSGARFARSIAAPCAAAWRRRSLSVAVGGGATTVTPTPYRSPITRSSEAGARPLRLR